MQIPDIPREFGGWGNSPRGMLRRPHEWREAAVRLLQSFRRLDMVCLSGKVAAKCSEVNGRHPKRYGYLFVVSDCKRCRYQKACKESVRDKKAAWVFDVSYEYWNGRTTAKNNLLSVKGIELRVNRSSQVEGVFGIVKQDMQYDRFRRMGLDKVRIEMCLILIDHLLRKLFTFYDGNARFDYWAAPADLQAETLPAVDTKKFKRKIRKKGINETVRKKSREREKVS